MSDDLPIRIAQAFEDPRIEGFADTAYDFLVEEAREADREVRKAFAQLVVAVIGFEFLLAAKVGDVSVLGVEVTDLSWLILLLPVLGSALLIRAYDATSRFDLYWEMTRALVRARYPMLARDGLDIFFAPGTNSMASSIDIASLHSPDQGTAKFHRRLGKSILYMLAFGPLLYGVSAYIRLYARTDLNEVAVTASLAISLTLTMFAWLHISSLPSIGKSAQAQAAETNEPPNAV